MIQLLILLNLVMIPVARAVAYSSPRGCAPYLGSLATAEAEPEHLMQVMISLWPRARAIFDHLDAKLRSGWLQHGIPVAEGESILAHVKNVVRAVRLVAISDPRLDLRRAMWMALIHDFAEHLVPDFTPRDRITASEKYRLEFEAFEEIVDWLGPPADFLFKLWIEFEEGLTREARLVRQLDALDATVKACDYERRGYRVDDFFDSVVGRVTDPRLVDALAAVLKRRHRPAFDYHAFYFQRLIRPERL